MTEDECDQVAIHCNEQKLAAKNAQEKSDHIFLCAFLRTRGDQVMVRGVSVGARLCLCCLLRSWSAKRLLSICELKLAVTVPLLLSGAGGGCLRARMKFPSSPTRTVLPSSRASGKEIDRAQRVLKESPQAARVHEDNTHALMQTPKHMSPHRKGSSCRSWTRRLTSTSRALAWRRGCT